jgi:ABC-type Fe3+-hydroxamate transport system substrate-binding protein
VERVISLVPSATETLLAWGVTPIAVTRFCEQPGYLTVGGTKNPDIASIVALEPDLVVMCPEENRLEDAERLRAAGVRIHAVRIDEVSDVALALDLLARELRIEPPALGPLPPPAAPRFRAFIPIWRRPWMTIGACYGSSALARIGVANAFADHADRYPTLGVEQLASTAVDVVLAPSEPYAFEERHRSELEQIAPVVFVDGKDLFWWGVRTPEALHRLAGVIDEIAMADSSEGLAERPQDTGSTVD